MERRLPARVRTSLANIAPTPLVWPLLADALRGRFDRPPCQHQRHRCEEREQRRVELGNSVAQIDAAKIAAEAPIRSIDDMINSRTAGVAVQTGTHIVHNPSAIMSIRGRCPVPELMERGVNVVLGSDGAAPDRGYDMFRHMAQCMHYHRRHFRDADVLPHGRVLEMATIDAARALVASTELPPAEIGWYEPHVLKEMAGLFSVIQEIEEPRLREAFTFVFSSLVVKFSRQRSASPSCLAARCRIIISWRSVTTWPPPW